MKFKMKSRSRWLLQQLAFVIVSVEFVGPVFAAPDNQGNEFILGFMENYKEDANQSSINFYLTAPKETTVTVQGEGFGPQTYRVSPNTITRVPDAPLPSLPLSLRASGSGTIENKGLSLLAPGTDEFVVYGLNQKKFTTDAYLGLPTDIGKELNSEYIVPSFSNAKRSLPGELLIIAHEGDTDVTITPTKATVGGDDVPSIKAGEAANFTLNRLQSIQFKAKGGPRVDFTGSVITSDKPISVFSGHQCGIVPRTALACDHLVEQIPPTNTWGTRFMTSPLATREKGDIFRILAANDNTTVEIDSKRVALLKRGKFKQVDLASGTFHEITTSGPALVIQYAKGTSNDGAPSDPFMMILPPVEQFGAEYVFSTPSADPVPFGNYINIIAPTNQLNGLLLDNTHIPSDQFTRIGTTEYSGIQLNVEIGTHVLKHEQPNVPIGLYSYGFAPSDSYGYPGGSRLANIVGPCTPTETVPGDGIDNDCDTDHKIDEELFNDIDDDGDGRIDEDLAKLVADAGGPYDPVDEGGIKKLHGTVVYPAPNEDELIFEWDLNNDGIFEKLGKTVIFFGIDGPAVQTVTLRVTDPAGSAVYASTAITVKNVAPTINSTNCKSSFDEKDNPHAFLTVDFTDPAELKDTYSAQVDWGDGSVELFNNITSGNTFSHPYLGYLPASVTVSDEDGGHSESVKFSCSLP